MTETCLKPAPDTPDRLIAQGEWTLASAAMLDTELSAVRGPVRELDACGVTRLDAAGALLLLQALRRLGLDAAALSLRNDHRSLLEAVDQASREDEVPGMPPPPGWQLVLAHIGQVVLGLREQVVQLLGFLGLCLSSLASVLLHPRRLRLTATVHHMEQIGWNAVPLVSLLSFLVGAVVAFLGATVLRDFGADLYVVELVSFAFLREFGVLLTAILLAGRTASAFAAQIGTMKSGEEIDAIRTLGLDPIELLVLPRLLALLVMLPLLSVIATLAGIAGGMLVAVLDIGMTPELFISRLHETLQLRHYLVGLSKAPVFAVVIALVGCLEGFKVAGTAQSVGEHTTSAVVQSISLVIIIDALAAVFFMEIGW